MSREAVAWVFEVGMRETRRAQLIAYGVAVLTPVLTLLFRLALEPVLGDAVPFMGFFPAVIIAAYIGGFWPGLLATLLSIAFADYFILAPNSPSLVPTKAGVVGLVLFVLTSLILSGLSEALHRSRRRIVAEERRRGEEARREAEDRYRSLMEQSPLSVQMFSPDGRTVRVNRAWEQLWNCTLDQLEDYNILSDPQLKTNGAFPYIERAFAGEAVTIPALEYDPDESLVHRPRHGDSKRWVSAVGFPLKDPQGRIREVVLIHQNITERKQAEEALRESERRWRNLTEALPQLVWTANAEGKIDYFSAQMVYFTGKSESELLLPGGLIGVLHPDDVERTRTSWLESVAQERNHEVEHRIRSADGTYRWFTTRGVPIRNAAGHIVKWFGTSTDITEHKRSEQALQESEQRWRSLTETLPQLVWTALPDGACDYFSRQWTQYTGVPTGQLLGWQWMEALHPDDREPTRQFWLDSVAGRHDYDVEYRVRRADGQYRWFKTRGVPIRDSDGRTFKWFGTCTDITGGKVAAEELRLAKEAAESANRAKDEFLANVSHEIRTPMNAILGLTSLVLGTELNEGQRQSLVTVKSAANNLLGIINDLLDFSKIEAGKLELSVGEFALRATLGDTMRALAVRAHQRGLELVFNVQAEVPDALIGDAGRLRQVLLNLIGNAIKFTEEGEVEVQVSAMADAAPANDEVHLLFTIRDTGIGIPKEKQVSIFRAFEQEDSSTTRRYGGTGLGLTISAQLAELMGGKIEVQSEPGRGSTFSFTTRFRRSSKRRAVGADQSYDLLDNLRVLIVDDNITNRQILEAWLRSWRMSPVAVGGGVAALNALREAIEAGAPYSLVLLDGRMPDGDGLTVARQIRERGDLSDTRVILLPSEDSSINVARFREMGINAYLLKPVQQSELLEAISHVMGRSTPEAAPAKVIPSPPESRALPTPAAPLHILVAEDNEFNVILLKQLFVQRGHTAQIAGNGRDAVALATAGTFSLLLLDIHMPEMDGFAVARAIREHEQGSGKHLPIIAFTARTGKADRERCLAAGMDGFLSKPVQAEALWEVIDRVVAANASTAGRKVGILDAQAILRACDRNESILAKICQAFQASVPVQFARIRAAMDDNDALRLREAAHSLCSTLAAFSTVAGTAASTLEDEAALGHLDTCRSLVQQLDGMCSELLRQTRDLSIDALSQ